MIAAVTTGIDQAAKAVALGVLKPGVPIEVVDGAVALTLGFNPGLAFGILGHVDESWRWVVPLVSVGALAILARIAYTSLPRGGWCARIAIGLIFGGAVSNLVDRVRIGAVVDFIDVYWRVYHWPAFNTADFAITVGATMLAVTLMNGKPGASPSE